MIKWFAAVRHFPRHVSVLAVALLALFVCGCEFSDKPVLPTAPPENKGKAIAKNVTVEGGSEYNFGTTEVGQEFEHVFIVTNKNDKEITVDKGPPSCATCTSFEIDKNKLQPNESLKATVKWRIKAENPEFRQFAPLMLPEGGQINLTVIGKVVKRIVLAPDVWNMGEMLEAKQQEFLGMVSSAILDKFEIASITAKNPALTVTAVPMSAEKLKALGVKSGYDLQAVLQPTIPIGEFTDIVTVNILEPKPIGIKVDVTARRSGPVRIFGPSWNEEFKTLSLGAFDPRQEQVSQLNLSTRGVDGELKIEKVICTDSRISIEVKPDERFKDQAGEFRRYELIFKIAASDQPVVYTRQAPLVIELETNQPLAKKIKLHLRCQAIP